MTTFDDYVRQVKKSLEFSAGNEREVMYHCKEIERLKLRVKFHEAALMYMEAVHHARIEAEQLKDEEDAK